MRDSTDASNSIESGVTYEIGHDKERPGGLGRVAQIPSQYREPT